MNVHSGACSANHIKRSLINIKLMKHKFSVLFIILFVTVFNTYSCQINSSGKDQKKMAISKEMMSDSVKNFIIFKVNNMLPIGWGTKYNCKVLSNDEAFNDILNNEFILSVSVGSEERFKPLDIHFLKYDLAYIAEFMPAEKSEKPYAPAGTTGFIDKNGFIWLMTSLKVYKE
jgi:hypothetical protein